jgi:hypothetical protein
VIASGFFNGSNCAAQQILKLKTFDVFFDVSDLILSSDLARF